MKGLISKISKGLYSMLNKVDGEYKTIELSEVKRMLDSNEAILIDVREPNELVEDGYIKDSINIPLGTLEERQSELDREKTYITFCAMGGRSMKAAGILSKAGFKHLYNAKEGMKAWSYDKVKR